jgi:RND family efflux transporter MFP subunit
VSQQDVDQVQATFDVQGANVTASQAAYTSAQANVRRLEDLKSFGTLVAPFDGVVTMRSAQVGQLVVAGAAGQPLFKIAQVDTLRVFVNVPQLHASAVHVGMHAPIRVRELRDRVFDGMVARTSNEIDGPSRSLLTEVDIPNPDGTLLAGMYARVRLDVEDVDRPVLVPATAVLFDAQGTRVAVVQDGVVRWKPVEIEADLGDRLAIARGVAEHDAVAAMASEQLVEGMRVRADEGKPGPETASTDHKPKGNQP